MDAINQITKVRVPDPTSPEGFKDVAIVDWSWRPLYSTLDILDGATDQQLFTFNYADGDNVSSSQNIVTAGAQRSATLTDCNNSSAGEMPAEEEFLVYAISIEVFRWTLSGTTYSHYNAAEPIGNAPNIGTLQWMLITSLTVSQKDYFQAGMGWFPTGYGPWIAPANTAGAALTYASNGFPSREAIDRAPVPVHIGGTEKFSVNFTNAGLAGANTITFDDDAGSEQSTRVYSLRTHLVGLHKRPAA